jgi:YidC/Oxa1 family membrane protein insertase
VFRALSRWVRELRDHLRFLFDNDRARKQLVFYAEKASDYRYLKAFVEDVLAHSDIEIAYLTSDPDDPLFAQGNPRLKVFYVDQLLGTTIASLDADVLAMTMPDLGRLHIARSAKDVDHVYVFHGVGSIHLQYERGAFDHYDTVFCLGPRDQRELRRWEELYETRPKTLVECGYPLIEEIHAEHARRGDGPARERPVLLVAPSWHEENVVALCLEPLIDALGGTEIDVVIRPHPEHVKRNPADVRALVARLDAVDNFTVELDMLSGASVHDADVLMTDWSGIAFEYALGTERPVLFVDTPRKVRNPDYAELGLEPIDFTAREELGVRVDPAALPDLRAVVDDLLAQREAWRSRILACRDQTLYNWGSAARVGGQALIDRCGARPGRR